MNILLVLVGIPILTVIISLALNRYYENDKKYKNKHAAKHLIHVMFPGHFALAFFTVVLCIIWFATGRDLIDYGCFWNVVERGTIEALTSVMSIVGVGSILLGWIYSERDKLTLGKSQIDMIHYCYGWGYAGSIITHFGASALAILMLKSAAKEAALWAFITVAWGCVPQAWICLTIAMNRERREMLALQLWKQQGSVRNEQVSVIHKMAGYLNETEVRYNSKYSEALASVIKNWLLDHYDQSSTSCGITEGNIKTASAIFRELLDKIPKQDHAAFEEEILKVVCDQLEVDDNLNGERKNVAALLLGCGYIRFLYAQATEELEQRISRAVYFYHQENEVYKNCVDWIQDCLCALEWYLFLNQRTEVPRNVTGKSLKTEYMEKEDAFFQLILSIEEDKSASVEETARIAWQQVQLGGKHE